MGVPGADHRLVSIIDRHAGAVQRPCGREAFGLFGCSRLGSWTGHAPRCEAHASQPAAICGLLICRAIYSAKTFFSKKPRFLLAVCHVGGNHARNSRPQKQQRVPA